MVFPNQSLCAQCFERPKLNTSDFGVRKGLLMEKVPTKRMRDLVMLQIHLACWNRPRDFKGLGEQVCRNRVSFNKRRTLKLGHLCNRASTPDLPGQRTFGLWKGSGVAVPVMSWFGSTCVWGEGERGFGFGCSWRSKSSLLRMRRLHDLQYWFVVSEEQLTISLNKIGPFWAGSAGAMGLEKYLKNRKQGRHYNSGSQPS